MSITLYAPCPYDMADSYGLIACQLVRHLTNLGEMVSAVSLSKVVTDSQPEDVRAVTSRPRQESDGGVALGYPTNYHDYGAPFANGPRIGLSMIECSKLPAPWVEELSRLDAIITPTRFCKEVFEQCGVRAPIHVVPLGIGESYRYAERSSERPLTFLAFLDRGARKGGMVALQAFLRAFGSDMNYKLILKGRRRKVTFSMDREMNPNIEVIWQDMSEAELYALYLECDVLINPHRGEGFGLIPREFAATGGISLTTNWSGTTDDLDEWGWPLPYRLVKADWRGDRVFAGHDAGEWAEPDVEGVAEVLRQVAAHVEHYRTEAKQRAAGVAHRYRWSQLAQGVLDVWREVTTERVLA